MSTTTTPSPDRIAGSVEVQRGVADLAQLLIGVALFDNMGPATRRSREHLPPSRIRPIPVSLVKAAINAVGYEVPAPR